MKERLKLTVLEYRIAVFWFLLFSVNSLCTSITASMAGSVWMNLGEQEKFTVIVAIIGNWTGTIMAFLSKASSRIKQDKPLEPTDTP